MLDTYRLRQIDTDLHTHAPRYIKHTIHQPAHQKPTEPAGCPHGAQQENILRPTKAMWCTLGMTHTQHGGWYQAASNSPNETTSVEHGGGNVVAATTSGRPRQHLRQRSTASFQQSQPPTCISVSLLFGLWRRWCGTASPLCGQVKEVEAMQYRQRNRQRSPASTPRFQGHHQRLRFSYLHTIR